MTPLHPFSPRSDVLPSLAPEGKTLLERSLHGPVPLWWLGRKMLHERTVRMLWFAGPEKAHRFDPDPIPPLRTRLHGHLGWLGARRVPVPAADRYADAATRVLYTGQNRQWPAEDGGATDRFFGPLVTHLRDDGIACGSIYPLSGSFPWYRPTPGRQIATARNESERAAPHFPFELFARPSAFRAMRKAAKGFREQGDVIAAHWDDLAQSVPELQDPRHSALVRDGVLHLFNTAFPVAVLLLEAAREAVRRLGPHLVVLINEYGLFERALQIAAREQGVPSLAVQHGVIHPYHPGYAFPDRYLGEEAPAHLRVPLSDQTAVYGPHHRRLLVETFGWPEDRVVVTGHPNGDRVLALRQVGRAPVAPEEGPILLWLTQIHGFPPEENHVNGRAIADALQRLPQARLVIKPHPNDDPKGLRPVADHDRVTLLDSKADLYPEIHGAHVAITKDSTTALEAMAFDRPVVILNTTRAPDRVDYVAKGAALRAHDGPTLAAAIQESLIHDPTRDARREYVVDQFGPIDGRSIGRLVATVHGLLT